MYSLCCSYLSAPKAVWRIKHVALKKKIILSSLSFTALSCSTMTPALWWVITDRLDLHGYVGNIRFPLLVLNDVWWEREQILFKNRFSRPQKEGSLFHIVLHTATVLVFVCKYVFLCKCDIQLHLCLNVEHSDRLKTLCLARASVAPPCCTIQEAPAAGGMQAHCSHPQNLHHSAGWSCTERCTLGSTGSAWEAADTFHRSPQIWSGAHMNQSRHL